jgi:hypothetical protein
MLAELFPGFTEELSGGGAPTLDYHDLSEVYFCIGGHGGPEGSARECPTSSHPEQAVIGRPCPTAVARDRKRHVARGV